MNLSSNVRSSGTGRLRTPSLITPRASLRLPANARLAVICAHNVRCAKVPGASLSSIVTMLPEASSYHRKAKRSICRNLTFSDNQRSIERVNTRFFPDEARTPCQFSRLWLSSLVGLACVLHSTDGITAPADTAWTFHRLKA